MKMRLHAFKFGWIVFVWSFYVVVFTVFNDIQLKYINWAKSASFQKISNS